MKSNTLLEMLIVIFFIMLFLMAWSGNVVIIIIWLLVTVILAILLLKHLTNAKTGIAEIFKKQSTIVKILEIAFIIALIYDIATLNGTGISMIILGLLIICFFVEWFSKKEES